MPRNCPWKYQVFSIATRWNRQVVIATHSIQKSWFFSFFFVSSVSSRKAGTRKNNSKRRRWILIAYKLIWKLKQTMLSASSRFLTLPTRYYFFSGDNRSKLADGRSGTKSKTGFVAALFFVTSLHIFSFVPKVFNSQRRSSSSSRGTNRSQPIHLAHFIIEVINALTLCYSLVGFNVC